MKKINTVKGTRDFLPDEKNSRDFYLSQISSIYEKYGFQKIETPVLEPLSILKGKGGNENEKLIFEILKRGEKLNQAIENKENLSEEGLRFDLTIPLSRYYISNRENLPSNFRAFQIGNVWRADRPSEGRYRQFVQCDADIVGDESFMAEIELISAAIHALSVLGISERKIILNDVNVLKTSIRNIASDDEEMNFIYKILDKLGEYSFEKISDQFGTKYKELKEIISNNQASERLQWIIDILNKTKKFDYEIEYNPFLARGMDYYTSTIYEIKTSINNGLSIGAGGRYDNLIQDVSGFKPACGISLGFERIFPFLSKRDSITKIAFIVEEDIKEIEKAIEISNEIYRFGEHGNSGIFLKKRKFNKQLDDLKKSGYSSFWYKNEFKSIV